MQEASKEPPLDKTPRVGLFRDVALLTLLVVGAYFSRLTLLPVCGEETRWADGAVQMIETGDWIVPRQQGQVFVDRPPLASWAMATVGLVRGEVDLVAIRLPSALAVLAATLVVYFYGRTFLSSFGALAAGAIFATLGQVLQLGRLGENEALFTLLVSASLLAWHAGYARGASPTWTWFVGYSLAALGGLQKGPQAPVYFFAATTIFLMIRRDRRWLVGWGHLAGLAAFAVLISLWQIPFWLATNTSDAIGVWTRSAAYRVGQGRLLAHMASYPAETLGCLLPWSALAVGILDPRIRKALRPVPQQIMFLVVSLVVTYPSVLLTSGSRTRYFMPLYPCVAIILAWIAQRCVESAPGSAARFGWTRYLVIVAAVVAAGGAFVAGASIFRGHPLPQVKQTPLWAAGYVALATATAGVLWWARRAGPVRARIAVLALAGFLAVSYVTIVMSAVAKTVNDINPAIAEVKQRIPRQEKLVSLGPIFHRFAYAYDAPIEEIPWPRSLADLPADVEYFCYDYSPGDNTQERSSGRGLYWTKTPGTLPFAWDQVAVVLCGRFSDQGEQRKVIIGKIRRGPLLASKSANKAPRASFGSP